MSVITDNVKPARENKEQTWMSTPVACLFY
jgi:hypothetical protein